MRIAHSVPTGKKNTREVVNFEGVNYPLVLEHGKGWRLRSRSIHRRVDFFTGTTNKATARKLAREHLETLKSGKPLPTTKTLADVVECYRSMAKRAGAVTEKLNVRMLTHVVRTVTGRELRMVHLHEIGPEMWSKYQAMRQGMNRVDLATRRTCHISINSALRAAVSIFIPKLRPQYARAGLDIPADACSVQWLQQPRHNPGTFPEDVMEAAWALLADRPLWFALALARFAGLRKEEITACRGKWLVQHEGVWCIELRDRQKDGFFTKTGAHYFAMITHPALIEAMQSVPSEELAVSSALKNRTNWLDRAPQRWLRQFMDDDISKPLHRLRAAYLTSIRRDALIRMQGQAVKEAASAGGHTSTNTTSRHYLPAQIAS
jgi:integrase